MRRILINVVPKAARALTSQAHCLSDACPSALLVQQRSLVYWSLNSSLLQSAQQRTWQGSVVEFRRDISTQEFDKRVEDINTLFVEARDEIDYAKEDAETVYFNDSVKEAKKAVDACLDKWDALLSELNEEERGKLQRSMGLKMEQLKAEYDEVAKLHLED